MRSSTKSIICSPATRATATIGEPFLRLVCATRSSALALHQARVAIARLATAGMTSTLLQISTRGDRDTERPLAALGGDNVFVKELELALREQRADYAVHSCKDLPSLLEADMRIAAIGPREDPRDVFCSERYRSFDDRCRREPSSARRARAAARSLRRNGRTLHT